MSGEVPVGPMYKSRLKPILHDFVKITYLQEEPVPPPTSGVISYKCDKCENALEYVLTETISDAFFEV